jgi:hypothetical protein
VSLTSFAPPLLKFGSVDAPYASILSSLTGRKETRTTYIKITCRLIKLQVTKPKPRPISERRFSLNRLEICAPVTLRPVRGDHCRKFVLKIFRTLCNSYQYLNGLILGTYCLELILSIPSFQFNLLSNLVWFDQTFQSMSQKTNISEFQTWLYFVSLCIRFLFVSLFHFTPFSNSISVI